MSRAAEQAFAALSQYFLNRLAARADSEFKMKAMAEDRKAREEEWRSAEAAKGEDRGIVRRMNGGQAVDMDVGRYFDPKTGKYEERVYGAMPVMEKPKANNWRSIGAGTVYREGPDGQPEFRTAPGATSPQRGGGGKAAAPKDPKRIWIDRGGESMLVTEAEVQKGDRPLDNSAAGRKRAEGREAVAGAWRAIGDVASAPARMIGSALGLGGKSGAAAAPAGPSLDQQAAATLQNASQRIAENPSARAAIEAQLKAAGYDELIPLLPKG